MARRGGGGRGDSEPRNDTQVPGKVRKLLLHCRRIKRHSILELSRRVKPTALDCWDSLGSLWAANGDLVALGEGVEAARRNLCPPIRKQVGSRRQAMSVKAAEKANLQD